MVGEAVPNPPPVSGGPGSAPLRSLNARPRPPHPTKREVRTDWSFYYSSFLTRSTFLPSLLSFLQNLKLSGDTDLKAAKGFWRSFPSFAELSCGASCWRRDVSRDGKGAAALCELVLQCPCDSFLCYQISITLKLEKLDSKKQQPRYFILWRFRWRSDNVSDSCSYTSRSVL